MSNLSLIRTVDADIMTTILTCQLLILMLLLLLLMMMMTDMLMLLCDVL